MRALEIGTGECLKREKKITPGLWKKSNIYGIWKGKCPSKDPGTVRMGTRAWPKPGKESFSRCGWCILWDATLRSYRISAVFGRTTLITLGLHLAHAFPLVLWVLDHFILVFFQIFAPSFSIPWLPFLCLLLPQVLILLPAFFVCPLLSQATRSLLYCNHHPGQVMGPRQMCFPDLSQTSHCNSLIFTTYLIFFILLSPTCYHFTLEFRSACLLYFKTGLLRLF